jgi:hypothetical protein
MGFTPLAKGDPDIGVSTPVLLLIEKAETVFEFELVTKINPPDGSIANPVGKFPPLKNGDPAIGVNAPVLLLIE